METNPIMFFSQSKFSFSSIFSKAVTKASSSILFISNWIVGFFVLVGDATWMDDAAGGDSVEMWSLKMGSSSLENFSLERQLWNKKK